MPSPVDPDHERTDSVSEPLSAVPSPAPGGRPYGSVAPVLADHRVLRHAHFTFVRFVLEGVGLRDAWLRCLAFAGGADDVRHIDRRLREICEQIRASAEGLGVAHLARAALDELARRRLAGAVAQAHRDAADAGARHSVAATLGSPAEDLASPAPSAAAGVGAAVATAVVVAPPPLDDWVQARCDELGIDIDFQSQADWLAEYQEAFDEPRVAASASPAPALPPPTSARAPAPSAAPEATAFRASALRDHEDADAGASPPRLREQVAALNAIATLVAVAPTLTDPIGAWLSSAQQLRLRVAGVLTLGHLADFIDVHGYRWYTRVDGLGAVRAARLVAWLAPLLDDLGRPLRDTSRRAAAQLSLAREARLVGLDVTRLERYGLVPLERLAIPPEIDGREGTFRVRGPNTFGVQDDLAAVRCWLRRYEASPRTYRAYLHGVEVFVLWCACVRRKALSSLVEDDVHAFRAFLAAPAADWIQPCAVERGDDAWRPLRGPLSPASQRHVITVVSALYRGLIDAGYVSVHAVSGVKPHLKLQRPTIDVRRRFTEAQWSHLVAVLAGRPDTPSTRRLRLVLELGATTGLRLSEMCTTRLGELRQEDVPGLEPGAPVTRVWLLTVVGKGNKRREVVIFDDVKALIDAHQRDLAHADLQIDPAAPLRSLVPSGVQRTLPDALATTPVPSAIGPAGTADPIGQEGGGAAEGGEISSTAAPATDPRLRPLVGALRRPVPRWRLGAGGVATLDRQVAQADAYGAIDPSALYQALKRLFARAGETAPEQEGQAGLNFDREAFEQASTHWLRHFFATTAAQDIDLTVLRDQMGHADLRTTSIYVAPERRALVAQMAKLRRRT